MYSHQSTLAPRGRPIALATYHLRHGDPQATEKGQWIIESPDLGYLGILSEQEITEATSIGAALTSRLEADGQAVHSVTTTQIDGWRPVCTAYAPAEPVDQNRASTITGLRDLASWLETNPEITISPTGLGLWDCLLRGSDAENAAELDRMRNLTAGDPHVRSVDGRHPRMIVEFGPVTYEVYYIPDAIRRGQGGTQ